MRSFYYLKEAAYELELNQRAEVKDVVKQILSPDDGNPFLTVSVYFPDPKRLITRGKCEKNGIGSLKKNKSLRHCQGFSIFSGFPIPL
jgi:hypothetical protein